MSHHCSSLVLLVCSSRKSPHIFFFSKYLCTRREICLYNLRSPFAIFVPFSLSTYLPPRRLCLSAPIEIRIPGRKRVRMADLQADRRGELLTRIDREDFESEKNPDTACIKRSFLASLEHARFIDNWDSSTKSTPCLRAAHPRRNVQSNEQPKRASL